jgi:hypothetical protein
MVSTLTGVCDAICDELTNNVPELRDALVHRYAPYDPEQLMAEVGDRHLAVFPAAEATDESFPLVTAPGGDLLQQLYRITYWESAGDESSRGYADQEAAGELLTLLEKVRARFYIVANLRLGGTDSMQYVGAGLPERSGVVRWFQITIRVRTSLIVTS